MKTVIYLIFIIGWAVLQARRKALREQKRKQAEQDGAQAFIRKAQQPIARGAVTEEENRASERQSDVSLSQRDATIPPAVQSFIESVKPKKKKKRIEQEAQPDEEKVEEIVTPFDMGPDAYAQGVSVRRKIGFDADSLRTFVVTREILGPPRAKRPHRPGIRQK